MYTDDLLGILEEFDELTTGGIFSILMSSPADLRRRGSDCWLPPEEFKAAQERSERELRRREYQRVSNLLARLQRRGLIEKKESKIWQLTERGLLRLQNNATISKYTPISKRCRKEDDHLKVVIFDVPEQHKKRREWLRFSLQNLGFKLLQKSVWIGKTKLPVDFFEQLQEFDLLPHVHIFAIQEAGSIGFNRGEEGVV
jgi:hypothetical protein